MKQMAIWQDHQNENNCVRFGFGWFGVPSLGQETELQYIVTEERSRWGWQTGRPTSPKLETLLKLSHSETTLSCVSFARRLSRGPGDLHLA